MSSSAGTGPQVVISGIGVVSPLGHTVEEVVGTFAAGRRCSVDAGGAVYVADLPLDVVPPDAAARIGRLDRLCQFFLAASWLAVRDARLTIVPNEAHRVGISFGTGLGCLLTDAEYNRKVVEQGASAASPRLFAYTVSSAAAGEVSIALGIKGPNVTAHMGFAAGAGAIGYGADLIRTRKADVVLAGGADVCGPALVEALERMRLLKHPNDARPFRDAVPGLVPSEAAVVFVLEAADHARARGARLWGTVLGYAAGFEPTLTASRPEAVGISATTHRALQTAAVDPSAIDLITTEAHGTPIDTVEQRAWSELFGGTPRAAVLAPKSSCGEMFAASSPLAAALALGCRRLPVQLADDVLLDGAGQPLPAAAATAALQRASLVMVESVCYSGSIVTLILALSR